MGGKNLTQLRIEASRAEAAPLRHAWPAKPPPARSRLKQSRAHLSLLFRVPPTQLPLTP